MSEDITQNSVKNNYIGVGFGTAGLGDSTLLAMQSALEAGFRKFDTAEESEYWYDQKVVGESLKSFFSPSLDMSKCRSCAAEDLQVSTKIPPWELTNAWNMREQALKSRSQLLGFCEEIGGRFYPLDVYYIHIPECYEDWHPNCEDIDEDDILPLRDAWLGMETIVGIDYSARRIGLSNISPGELLDIIEFVEERQNSEERSYPPPRLPDAVQEHADPLEPSHEIREICRKYGIEFVSYSTLGTQHMDSDEDHNPVLGSEVVLQLAKNYNRSTAEIVLSWAIQQNMSVIPCSSKPAHISELAHLLHGAPFLDESDLIQIDRMAKP